MSAPGTIGEFLRFDDHPTRTRANAQALEKAPEVATRALPSALRGPAADAILFTAKALLEGQVSGVIVSAWSKLRELEKFLQAPPEETHHFTLHDHEIALKRSPSVELMLNEAPSGVRLHFELKLALQIASAELVIQRACIVGAKIGGVRGSGSFSCGQAVLGERKTETYRLPNQLTFSPGMPIKL